MNKQEVIEDYLNSLSTSEMVEVYNRFCESVNDTDSEIHENDEEFFKTFFKTTSDAVRAVCFGNYEYCHEYVRFNGYGNLDTTDYPVSDWMSIDEIASDIVEDEETYSDLIDVDNILSIYEEENDDNEED